MNNIINGINLKVDEKYPEVNFNLTDKKLAMEYKKSYVQEINAVNQYVYDEFITENNLKELKITLKSIARDEMEHIELLSKIITNLGGNPNYTYINDLGNQDYYSTNRVYYNTDINKFLKYNINKEKEVILEYERLLKITGNDNIKSVINRIILDEKKHIELLNSFLNLLI
ncbi:MAG: hypothetical protein GX663_10595 [Clostridiales bacterium]|nr:hypothetical protein [Clostridiales bacterium]